MKLARSFLYLDICDEVPVSTANIKPWHSPSLSDSRTIRLTETPNQANKHSPLSMAKHTLCGATGQMPFR